MAKNIKSLVGLNPNSKLIKEYKSSLTSLTSEQWEASIGLMLGDASLQTQNKGRTYRLKFEWGDKNKDYLDHVFNLFNEWVLSEPHKKTRISPKGNTVINWGFQTISHTAFNDLAVLFFDGLASIRSSSPKEGLAELAAGKDKKSISEFLIKEHLTERGLAYWFMDDGGKLDYNLNSKNQSIVLNTQSFTEGEVDIMSSELSNKFKFECEVRCNKGKKIIVIKSTSFPLFQELVVPYIIPEMRYKLPTVTKR